jgi:hypothetical protein
LQNREEEERRRTREERIGTREERERGPPGRLLVQEGEKEVAVQGARARPRRCLRVRKKRTRANLPITPWFFGDCWEELKQAKTNGFWHFATFRNPK